MIYILQQVPEAHNLDDKMSLVSDKRVPGVKNVENRLSKVADQDQQQTSYQLVIPV